MTTSPSTTTETDMIYGWRALSGAMGVSTTTLRDWEARGMPMERDGRSCLFSRAAVESWRADRDAALAERSGGDDDEDDGQNGELLRERIRKTRAEADKLEHDKLVREGKYAPVAQFEQALERELRQVRDLVTTLVDDLKSGLPELSAARSEEMDRRVIECFQRIATG